MSNIESLLKEAISKKEKDPIKYVASKVLKKAQEEITKEDRDYFKQLILPIMYGARSPLL